jgi:hypothetical protein
MRSSRCTVVAGHTSTAQQHLHHSNTKKTWVENLTGNSNVSKDCFPLSSDKVTTILHCWVSRMWWHFRFVSRPFSTAVHRVLTGGTLKQTWLSSKMFLCEWVSDKPRSAKILDCCPSQQCRLVTTLSGQKGSQIHYRITADLSYHTQDPRKRDGHTQQMTTGLRNRPEHRPSAMSIRQNGYIYMHYTIKSINFNFYLKRRSLSAFLVVEPRMTYSILVTS